DFWPLRRLGMASLDAPGPGSEPEDRSPPGAAALDASSSPALETVQRTATASSNGDRGGKRRGCRELSTIRVEPPPEKRRDEAGRERGGHEADGTRSAADGFPAALRLVREKVPV